MNDPGESITKQSKSRANSKAAYNLLSNPAIDPHAIQQQHRKQTLGACGDHPVVLCVQDTTQIDLTTKTSMRGRGKIGNGNGNRQGILQHSALAVIPSDDTLPIDASPGELLGLLHQQWHSRVDPPEGETLRQLQQRRTEADVWQETAAAVAQLGGTAARLIHVGDRHSDMFRFFNQCNELGHGYLVRARFDRELIDDQGQPLPERLFEHLAAQPILDQCTLTVHEQRTASGDVRCDARMITLGIRYARITIDKPGNDVRTKHAEPIEAHAVMVQEIDPANECEPLRWILLTSEPVNSVADAWRIVRYYRHRWIIEEWHRVLKEGCRIEAARFDEVLDVQRLAAIKGVVAVVMLQLRDLAERAGDEPEVLQAAAPQIWIEVVAWDAKLEARTLTPRQFYLAIAKRGGYLGRKRDPRPGWKVLWKGWRETMLMVHGAQLMRKNSG